MKKSKERAPARKPAGAAFIWGALLAGLIVAVTITACGGDDDDDNPSTVAVESVTVKPETLSLVIGKTGTLTATVTPDNASEKGITWTTADATVATVSDAGEVTGKAVGTVVITATSKADATKSATATVTVVEENLAAITTVATSGSAIVGETLTAEAKSADSKVVTDATFTLFAADSANGTYTPVTTETAVAFDYTFTVADEGKYFKVEAKNLATTAAVASAVIGPVTAAGTAEVTTGAAISIGWAKVADSAILSTTEGGITVAEGFSVTAWYLDGVAQESTDKFFATGSAIKAPYEVTVAVTKDEKSYSATLTFTVDDPAEAGDE